MQLAFYWFVHQPHQRLCWRVICAAALGIVSFFAAPTLAGEPQTAPLPAAPKASWTVTVRNTTRSESWRFFTPPTGGGTPDYTFLANRLNVDLRRASARFDVTAGGQYVTFTGLPASASGPGPLGTGALYFDQGGRRSRPQQFSVRYASVTAKNVLAGVDVQAGRMAYNTGTEVVTTDAKLESVRRQRLSARLVGEFEWSLYQRSFDGVRLDVRRPRWQLTSFAFQPTQGGFSHTAGNSLQQVFVGGATLSGKGQTSRSAWQGFVVHYDDTRRMAARPDNSGTGAAAIDVAITAIGGSWIGAHKTARGDTDAMLWIAMQTGSWYGQPHRAAAFTAEAGHQWTTTAWAPWLRGGWSFASGDADGKDGRHGTFFPMLPTMRRFSLTTMYATMNLHDIFGQLLLRPTPKLNLRVDVHGLRLASAADLWYGGSGATVTSGANFGYAGRRSNGATGLGTSVEAGADLAVTPKWSLNGFVGHMSGGPVIRGTFAGDRLWFAYLESALRFDWRR